MFLAGVSVEKVESERHPPLATVKRESFAHPSHRAMLAHHDIERAWAERVANRTGDAIDGPERLRVAHLEYTSHHTPPRSST